MPGIKLSHICFLLYFLLTQAQRITCIAWSGVSRKLAAATDKGALVLLSVGFQKREVIMSKHSRGITGIAWSGCDLLALAGRDNQVRIPVLSA